MSVVIYYNSEKFVMALVVMIQPEGLKKKLIMIMIKNLKIKRSKKYGMEGRVPFIKGKSREENKCQN